MPHITNSTTTSFTFDLDWGDGLSEGDFVSVDVEQAEFIGQITRTQTAEESIRAESTLVGNVPDLPFPRGTPVQKADEEAVIDALNLEDTGTWVGSIRGLDNNVYLNPDEAMNKHFGIYGRTSSGKSHTATVLSEETLENDDALVVIDPHGEYASLADGDSDYNVVEYANTSVNSSADESLNVAESSPCDVVEKGVASIINLKGVEGAKQLQLVERLLSELFDARTQRKIPKTKVLVDEAHNFAGKRQDSRCDVMETVASEGRKFGLTFIFVSQRPSRIDTNVRSQMQVLVLHKLTDDTDISKAIGSAEGIDNSWAAPIQKLGQGECIISGDLLQSPIIVEVRKRKSRNAVVERPNKNDSVTPGPDSHESGDYAHLREKISILEEERDEIKAELESYRHKVEAYKRDYSTELSRELESTKKELQRCQRALTNSEEETEKYKRTVDEMAQEIEQLNTGIQYLHDPNPELRDEFIEQTVELVQQRLSRLDEDEYRILEWFYHNETGSADAAFLATGRQGTSSQSQRAVTNLAEVGFISETEDEVYRFEMMSYLEELMTPVTSTDGVQTAFNRVVEMYES